MGTGAKKRSRRRFRSQFSEKYDPHKYQNPCNTVDMAVFAYNESEKKVTKVLLIQRGNHPSIGWWRCRADCGVQGNLETAAARELQEETGIEHLNFEQLKHMVHMTGTRVRGLSQLPILRWCRRDFCMKKLVMMLKMQAGLQ